MGGRNVVGCERFLLPAFQLITSKACPSMKTTSALPGTSRSQPPLTRRDFARRMAVALAVPYVLTRRAHAADSGTRKPNIAWVGLGGQGLDNLANFAGACNAEQQAQSALSQAARV